MGFIEALIAGHSIIGSISVIFNAFLLFTIIRVTPKNTSAYAILMGATALWDMLGSMACLLCMSRLMVLENHVVLISHGPCSFISGHFCFLSFDTFLACANATYYTTLASFIARLMILKNGSIDRKRSFMLLITCVLWHTIAVFIIFGSSQISSETALSIAIRKLPEFSSDWNVMATESVRNFTVAYPLIHISVFIFPVYVVIWLLRVATVRSLSRKASKMSNSTLNNHERVVKILTLQSIVPFITVFCNLIFIMRQVTEIRNPLLESSTLLILEMASICSPIIVFVHLPAYKKVVLRLFRCSTAQIIESDHVNSTDGQRRPVVRVKSADRRS